MENAFSIAPLLLILPIIGVLFNGFVGRKFFDYDQKLGEKWSGWFAVAMAAGSFLVAVSLANQLIAADYHSGVVTLFDWFNLPSAGFRIPWAIQVDTLSVTMMLVVTGVGSLIHIYAMGYMHGDPNFSRFFTYLNLFLFFMLILVAGNNYMMLFVGWEGVGLCSFLLIGFWFDRTDEAGEPMNANAARKAFVANRVGDLAMILAMILTFWTFGSLEFDPVFDSAIEMFQSNEMVELPALFRGENGPENVYYPLGAILTTITALFLMGAAGKSAQVPLYIWLPDAMAGPTPVSALIHAATMVTSGIYLIVRSNVLFEITRESGALLFGLISSPDLVAYVGAFTALSAGLIAFTQFDIKKVLAYSTVSQLGFMIAAAGMGAYVAAMFHLITHAFFKALLFMGSGSVIHGMEHGHHHLHDHGDGHDHDHDSHHAADKFDPQDMRTMGDLRNRMPITFWLYMIGSLALAGVPFFAGFWSKDEILAHANEHNQIVYWVLTLAAVCTAFYMGRQLKMVFFGEARHEAAAHAEESPPLMWGPLVVLAVLAIFGGWWINRPYLDTATWEANDHHPHGEYLVLEGWLEHSIRSFELTKAGIVHMPHTPTQLSITVASISSILGLLALGLAFFVVYKNKPADANQKDPLQAIPGWSYVASLPLDSLIMKGLVPEFNSLADFVAFKVDWDFWHDFVHNNLIRNAYIGWARFLHEIADVTIIDGWGVKGVGYFFSNLADTLRESQTGYARNYALSIFIGAIAILAWFLFV